MTTKGNKHPEPTAESLAEMPEIDDRRFRRRPGQGHSAGRSAGALALASGKRKPIRLHRRFFELKENTDDDLAEHQLAAYGMSKDITWPELLQRPCVVVLGEAGTGKTTEFKQRCGILAAEDEFAFYLTVHELAVDGLVGALRSEAQERFAEWKSSAERAYFFLDAVDEARLNGQTFRRALTKLEQGLGTTITRTHLLISCRVSDWRARSDREEVQSILFGHIETEGAAANEASDPSSSVPRQESRDASPMVQVFALTPLDTRRVEALASSLGVANPAAFVAAAREATAQAFLDRPRDVEWLASYWLQHGEFGTLSELVENDVREKLVERNPNRRPEISLATAKAAAEVLAGVSRLERKSTFLLPDEALDVERASTSIDPSSVLVNLSATELADLLRRPLFDEATYGRVRIHHRTVAEYLAAQWLETLLRAGLSPAEVDAVLFRDGPDGPVVPKELVAVAAWLSGSRVDLRKRLLEVAPTVLLEGGDPSNLTAEERADLLRALSKLYSNRRRLFKEFDRDALRRLSSVSIVETVKELLTTAKSDEFLETLIAVVAEGHLEGCADLILSLAASNDTPINARHEAVRALSRVGSNAQIQGLVRDLVDDASALDHELAGTIVATFYPAWISTKQLIAVLSRAEPPPPQTATSLPHLIARKIFDDTPAEQRADLLRGVFELVRDGDDPAHAERWWLIDPLANLVAKFARVETVGQLAMLRPIFGLFARLAATHQLDHETGEEEIRTLISERTDLRRLMFWEYVQVCRTRRTQVRSNRDCWSAP